ncbi:hypothetical protein VPH35_096354 [Triticum aestivum]
MAAPQPAGFSSSSAQRRGAVDPPPLGPSARSEVCGRGRASPAGPRQRRPTSKGQGPGDGREREDEREKKEGEEGERERGKRRRRRGVGWERVTTGRGLRVAVRCDPRAFSSSSRRPHSLLLSCWPWRQVAAEDLELSPRS